MLVSARGQAATPDRSRLRVRDALLLGALHGPAELLPVSSSGHVAVVPWLLALPYAQLDDELRKAFEVVLHAGTAAAIAIAGRAELARAVRTPTAGELAFAAVALGPPSLAGLVLERPIERRLGTPATIAAGLAAGAVALIVADTARGRRARSDATLRDALALGLAQACALCPGVSRNGATLAAARARGFARPAARALSDELAMPVIVAASGLKLLRLARRRALPAGAAAAFAAGAGATFASTLAARRLIAGRDRDRPLLPAAGYRLALAGLIAVRLRARPRPAATPRGSR